MRAPKGRPEEKGGPLKKNPELGIGVGRADMRQDRCADRDVLRTSCTATAPKAVRTFRTQATARTYP